MIGQPDLGLYLHLPFCHSRCSYCAFYVVIDDAALRRRYVAALCRELRKVADRGRRQGLFRMPPQAGRELASVYFGGGTPSLLDAGELEQILQTIRSCFRLLPGAEVSLEANPETVTGERASDWARAGINRTCLGAQSFQNDVLRRLGRRHDAEGVRRAVSCLRQGGSFRVSLDVIAGVQSASLEQDLAAALELSPGHLSLYLLEVDEEEVGAVTGLARQVEEGRFQVPDEDWFARAYPMAVEQLARAGLERYEISNFCRQGQESRHNLRYWTGQEVLGVGVSAHSFVGGVRHALAADLNAYLAALEKDRQPQVTVDEVSREQRVAEAWILGLRLARGVTAAEVAERTGAAAGEVEAAPERLDPLLEAGLLSEGGGRYRLTEQGILLSNEVFQAFLP